MIHLDGDHDQVAGCLLPSLRPESDGSCPSPRLRQRPTQLEPERCSAPGAPRCPKLTALGTHDGSLATSSVCSFASDQPNRAPNRISSALPTIVQPTSGFRGFPVRRSSAPFGGRNVAPDASPLRREPSRNSVRGPTCGSNQSLLVFRGGIVSGSRSLDASQPIRDLPNRTAVAFRLSTPVRLQGSSVSLFWESRIIQRIHVKSTASFLKPPNQAA